MKHALASVLVLVLSGCASLPDSSNPPIKTSPDGAPGNRPAVNAPATRPAQSGSGASANVATGTMAGAVAGAAAGCALARLIGEKCSDGAAIGAVIGAVVGWSVSTEKVGSAQSVNEQARKEGLPVPDNEIRLKQYTLTPAGSVVQAGGAALEVVGDIQLYGHARRNPEVEQRMLLYKGNGEATSDTPQIARLEKVDGAGHYRAVGVYKIPRGMEPGRYRVQSDLYIDGKLAARRETVFQVGPRADGARTSGQNASAAGMAVPAELGRWINNPDGGRPLLAVCRGSCYNTNILPII